MEPPDAQPEPTKRCARCGASRPVAEFVRDRSRRDERGPYCRDCRRAIGGHSPYGSEEHARRRSQATTARHREGWPPERIAFLEAHPELRWCSKCQQALPLVKFRKRRSRAGWAGWCKDCNHLDSQRRYRQASTDPSWRESRNNSLRNHYAANQEKMHLLFLQSRYGLEAGQYAALLSHQDGRCAICHQLLLVEGSRRPSVDHDHATHEVRGLLCARCNLGLGRFRDEPELLRAAIRYLVHPPARDLGGG